MCDNPTIKKPSALIPGDIIEGWNDEFDEEDYWEVMSLPMKAERGFGYWVQLRHVEANLPEKTFMLDWDDVHVCEVSE